MRVWAAVLAATSLLGCGQTTKPTDGEPVVGIAGDHGVEATGGRAPNGGSQATGGSSGGKLSGGGATSGGSGGTFTRRSGCQDVAPTSQLPRLTNAQYARTLRDLLGVTSLDAFQSKSPSELLAPDREGELTAQAWKAYLDVGAAVAKQVIANPELRRSFLVCTPAGDGKECLHDSIVRFGRRAFRRPMTQEEVARFDAIVEQGPELTETGDSLEVAEVLLETFLVSPSFLQRAEVSQETELDARFPLSSHEVAARLSYLYWGSTPDAELDLAADEGRLLTTSQIYPQAVRLLADQRARDPIAAFHRFYLTMDDPNSHWSVPLQKDPDTFPDFDASVSAPMREELERFFDTLVFERRAGFSELFSSNLGFVNTDTAGLYGLDPGRYGSELEEVELDPRERPGFLTRLGFLATFAYAGRTAPSLRGGFVMKELLGVLSGAHPTAPVMVPMPPDPSWTNRDRVASENAGAPCMACHELVDAPGFVLEAFDALGAVQTTDNGKPVNTVADVYVDSTRATVQDPEELMGRLAASAQARSRYAERWVSFAYGRQPNANDQCIVDELATRLAADDYALLDAFADATLPDTFRLRTTGAP